jgi:hypothetical protein
MTTENKTIRQFNFVVVCEVTEIDGVEHREWFLDDERTYVFLKNHGVYDYEDLDGTPRQVKPEEMDLYNDMEEVICSMLEHQTDWEKEK